LREEEKEEEEEEEEGGGLRMYLSTNHSQGIYDLHHRCWIAFYKAPHIHPFIPRRRCQPCKVTTNTSGAGRVRWRLAQGLLDT